MPLVRRKLRKYRKHRAYTRSIPRTAAAWRRRRVMRSAISVPKGVHYHARWSQYLQLNSSNGGGFFAGTTKFQASGSSAESALSLAFCLADVPNYSELSNIYDQYKIKCVKVTVQLINNPDSSSASGLPVSTNPNYSNFYPTLWYAPDHDDNNYSSVVSIKEYGKVKKVVMRPNQCISIMVRPTTLQQLYLSSTSAAYAINYKQPWLDMANTAIPHYGLKMVFDYDGLGNTTSSPWVFQVNCRYYFMCKNTR